VNGGQGRGDRVVAESDRPALRRPDAWKAELHALRRHPWADVRDAALAV